MQPSQQLGAFLHLGSAGTPPENFLPKYAPEESKKRGDKLVTAFCGKSAIQTTTVSRLFFDADNDGNKELTSNPSIKPLQMKDDGLCL